MSLCSNGCQDCATNLGNLRHNTQFSPESVLKAFQSIASSLEEKRSDEMLDIERTMIRCDGGVKVYTRRAVVQTLQDLFIALASYREACREKAKTENTAEFRNFDIPGLFHLHNKLFKDLEVPTLTYEGLERRFDLKIGPCIDTYW